MTLTERDPASKGQESRRFSVYLPVDYLQVVDEIANRRLTSRAAVIRELVADAVRREQVA